jgi:hypothetical protein
MVTEGLTRAPSLRPQARALDRKDQDRESKPGGDRDQAVAGRQAASDEEEQRDERDDADDLVHSPKVMPVGAFLQR